MDCSWLGGRGASIVDPNWMIRQWTGRLVWRNDLSYSVDLNENGFTGVGKINLGDVIQVVMGLEAAIACEGMISALSALGLVL
eukprot:9327071-Ditylum_brightwellii.AAC.2